MSAHTSRLRLVLSIWLVSCTLSFACAQQEPTLDESLDFQDRRVEQRFSQDYRRDDRYNAILNRVTARLQSFIPKVFSKRAEVHYYVYYACLGFNANTWHHLIIFDSLLLDAMRNLSCGVAKFGTTDCEYTERLAARVARTDRAWHLHTLVLDPNLQNPYQLPIVEGLDETQRQEADALFEGILAFWMAHELSHAMLNHYSAHLESAVRVGTLHSNTDTYAMTREKERQADYYGDRLAIRAGYDVKAMLVSLELVDQIEQVFGEGNPAYRTHPSPQARMAIARRAAAEVMDQKQAPP